MTETDENASAPEWPAHFPEDCPPGDARDLQDRVFYLVSSTPPIPGDFMSALERRAFPRSPECQRASLSCGLDAPYLEQLRETVPRLKEWKIAAADLTAEHGKVKQTGKPGHHSLWLRRTVLENAAALFSVIE